VASEGGVPGPGCGSSSCLRVAGVVVICADIACTLPPPAPLPPLPSTSAHAHAHTCNQVCATMTPRVDMDISGFDITCGGSSFCKVCGGLDAVKNGCVANGRCVCGARARVSAGVRQLG
jgi:hypothetical protein